MSAQPWNNSGSAKEEGCWDSEATFIVGSGEKTAPHLKNERRAFSEDTGKCQYLFVFTICCLLEMLNSLQSDLITSSTDCYVMMIL